MAELSTLILSPSGPQLWQSQHLAIQRSRRIVRTAACCNLHNRGRTQTRWVRCNSTSAGKEEEAEVIQAAATSYADERGDSDRFPEPAAPRKELSLNDRVVGAVPALVPWALFIAYCSSSWSPNFTPVNDGVLLQSLLLLNMDGGAFGRQAILDNPILLGVFYGLGLLPLIYSMLLIPTGRSEKNSPPIWPFSVASFFVGIFAMLPYCGFWSAPPPRVTNKELSKFPLVIFESKIFAAAVLAAAVGLVSMVAVGTWGTWEPMEVYSAYFRGSRFVHVMSLDFCLLHILSVFWVDTDATFRKWDKMFFFFPISLIPLVGPALYLLLRPGLPANLCQSEEMVEEESTQVG